MSLGPVGGSQGSAQPLISWAGPTPVGPVTLDGLDTLSLTGSGLAPSTAYEAVLLGKQGPRNLVDPEVPTGPPQSVVTTRPSQLVTTIQVPLLNSGQVSPTFNVANIPAGTRALP